MYLVTLLCQTQGGGYLHLAIMGCRRVGPLMTLVMSTRSLIILLSDLYQLPMATDQQIK